jgi:hypothetical protein
MFISAKYFVEVINWVVLPEVERKRSVLSRVFWRLIDLSVVEFNFWFWYLSSFQVAKGGVLEHVNVMNRKKVKCLRFDIFSSNFILLCSQRSLYQDHGHHTGVNKTIGHVEIMNRKKVKCLLFLTTVLILFYYLKGNSIKYSTRPPTPMLVYITKTIIGQVNIMVTVERWSFSLLNIQFVDNYTVFFKVSQSSSRYSCWCKLNYSSLNLVGLILIDKVYLVNLLLHCSINMILCACRCVNYVLEEVLIPTLKMVNEMPGRWNQESFLLHSSCWVLRIRNHKEIFTSLWKNKSLSFFLKLPFLILL